MRFSGTAPSTAIYSNTGENLIDWSENLAVCLHEFYRDSDPIQCASESVDLSRPFNVGGRGWSYSARKKWLLGAHTMPFPTPIEYFQRESSEGKPRMQRETVSVLVENL